MRPYILRIVFTITVTHIAKLARRLNESTITRCERTTTLSKFSEAWLCIWVLKRSQMVHEVTTLTM